MADKRTYIRVHDGMDEHPKIEPLSDKAFRVLMTTWFWCSRNKTDGRVPNASWAKRGNRKVRAELEAELVHCPGHDCPDCPPVPDGYVLVHDYLEHQRSTDQIDAAIEKKRIGGILGNHRRWHVNGYVDPDCEFCHPPDRPPKGSDNRSGSDRITDPAPIGYSDTEDRGQKEKKPTPVGRATHDSTVRGEPPPPRGASGPTAADAFRLVRRALGLELPAATCTGLAIQAAELLQQFDEATVAEALGEWMTRTGIGPNVLPSLVADIVKRRNGVVRPRHGKPDADDTIRALMAPTGTDDGATILQLPRGDT